jgi:hypothetical protein
MDLIPKPSRSNPNPFRSHVGFQTAFCGKRTSTCAPQVTILQEKVKIVMVKEIASPDPSGILRTVCAAVCLNITGIVT